MNRWPGHYTISLSFYFNWSNVFFSFFSFCLVQKRGRLDSIAVTYFRNSQNYKFQAPQRGQFSSKTKVPLFKERVKLTRGQNRFGFIARVIESSYETKSNSLTLSLASGSSAITKSTNSPCLHANIAIRFYYFTAYSKKCFSIVDINPLGKNKFDHILAAKTKKKSSMIISAFESVELYDY